MASQDRLFLSSRAFLRRLLREIVKQLLQLDPDIAEHLAPLEGKLLAVELTELPRLFIWVNDGKTELMWETNESPDGTIRINLSSKVHIQSRTRKGLSNSQVCCEVLGDLDTKREVQKFFSAFEPDWEERLSAIIGDMMARKAVKDVRTIATFSRNASYSLMRNFGEYLKEERHILAGHPRIQRHGAEVARLEESINALETRLSLLNSQAH